MFLVFCRPAYFLRLEVMASFTCCDCHQPHLNPKIQVPTDLVQHIQDIYIQYFKKNVLFESYGIIYLPCYVPRILSPRAIGSPTRGTNRLSTTCAIDWSIMLPFPIPGPLGQTCKQGCITISVSQVVAKIAKGYAAADLATLNCQ